MENNAAKGKRTTDAQSRYRWVMVVASFCAFVMAYSGAYSFGVFLRPLREDFGWTTAATSAAFSLLMFSYCTLGILSGLAVDKFGPRTTTSWGGLFMGLGLLLTSQIQSRWHIYMTYGLLIGPGMSTAYTPLLTTVSRWFRKRRGLALGIVTAGAGLSSLIVPPIASFLISTSGWRSAYLILGIAVGSAMITIAMFLREAPYPIGIPLHDQRVSETVHKGGNGAGVKKQIPDSGAAGFSLGKALRGRAFWLLGVMQLMSGFGLQMMLAHVVPFAQESLKVSPMVAATVLSTIGAASIAGKLIMGSASDRIGNKRALTITTSIEGIMIVGLLISSSPWMLYLSAGIFGFGYGGHVPQFPALTGEIFGVARMGTIMGTNTIFYGVGGALGPVLAGYIFDASGKYTYAFLSASAAMLLTAALTFLLENPKQRDTAEAFQ